MFIIKFSAHCCFQITFHPNDHGAFQDLADEIKAFEGLAHDSLVKYYGCEVHRVRKYLLLFLHEFGKSLSIVDALFCFLM